MESIQVEIEKIAINSQFFQRVKDFQAEKKVGTSASETWWAMLVMEIVPMKIIAL